MIQKDRFRGISSWRLIMRGGAGFRYIDGFNCLQWGPLQQRVLLVHLYLYLLLLMDG